MSFVAAAALLRGEPVSPLSALGVALGFGGVLLIARPWAATGHIDGGGVLAMLVGSTSVGLSFVYARRFLSGLAIPAAALTTYQMGIALATLAAVTDYRGISDIRHDTRAAVALVVGLGLLGTGVAYILYYLIVERLGAVVASTPPTSRRSSPC